MVQFDEHTFQDAHEDFGNSGNSPPKYFVDNVESYEDDSIGKYPQQAKKNDKSLDVRLIPLQCYSNRLIGRQRIL